MPRPKQEPDIKTSSELRKVLLDTIRGVRKGDVEPRQGATVAALAKAVIASAKLDFQVIQFHESIKTVGGTGKVTAIELAK